MKMTENQNTTFLERGKKMDCPECGSTHQPSGIRCDCGYSFIIKKVIGKPQESKSTAKPQESVSTAKPQKLKSTTKPQKLKSTAKPQPVLSEPTTTTTRQEVMITDFQMSFGNMIGFMVKFAFA